MGSFSSLDVFSIDFLRQNHRPSSIVAKLPTRQDTFTVHSFLCNLLKFTMDGKSEYFKLLLSEHPDVAQRYQQKIAKINNLDPFSIKESDLIYKPEALPPITNMDIVSYLVLTTSYYTSEQMKAFKSLSAFKYFEAGFVHKCGSTKINEYILIIGHVKHSQRMNAPPLHAWILCREDGSIETAHCKCMAGAGEVCSHVGAILYAVESINSAKQATSCTDVLSLWNIPKVTKVEYQPLKRMDFGRIIGSHKMSKQVIPQIEEDEMVEMLHLIEGAGGSSVLMRVVEPFASTMQAQDDVVPNLYQEMYKKEYEDLSRDQLLQLVSQFKPEVDEAYCMKVKELTKEQASSRTWFHHRAGKITASKFKAVCRTSVDTPSLSLLKTICYPTNFIFKTKATTWGINHEKDALSAYTAQFNPYHENLRVEKVGLCLHPNYPQFGASPDAMVHCDCCGSGCIEVKCPFTLKTMSIEEFASRKTSCLIKTDEGEIFIDKTHSYYYQMQMQMALTEVKFCDFVVWSPKEFFHERVIFNEDFWLSESQKAIEFHNKVILPELVGRFFTKDSVGVETWCVCEGIDDGRPMICCDNDNCNIRWHHFECVGLSDVPSEAWICDQCAGQQ